MADQSPMTSPSPKPVKPLAAWVCLLLNLLVLPGLGSLIVRQPRKAFIQIVLALGGIALSMIGLGPVLKQFVQTNELPDQLGNGFWMAVAGVVLFLIAWVWAFIGSVSAVAKSGDKKS
jgi:hypothetical protein